MTKPLPLSDSGATTGGCTIPTARMVPSSNALACGLDLERDGVGNPVFSPEKSKQNARLLGSGISEVKQKTHDVHGSRKL